MNGPYCELVIEGHFNAVSGFMLGYTLGSNSDATYYFSRDVGVKAETLSDIILEWISLKAKLQHVIAREDLCQELRKSLESAPESAPLNSHRIKSAKVIKNAHFNFSFRTYARKYGADIKRRLKERPEGILLTDYEPKEEVHEESKGVELYAPDHDYIFEGKGILAGSIVELIEFRKVLDDNPLINAEEIILEF